MITIMSITTTTTARTTAMSTVGCPIIFDKQMPSVRVFVVALRDAAERGDTSGYGAGDRGFGEEAHRTAWRRNVIGGNGDAWSKQQ